MRESYNYIGNLNITIMTHIILEHLEFFLKTYNFVIYPYYKTVSTY